MTWDGAEGADSPRRQTGSLIVVGTGFMVAGQITPEARAAMEGADRLLHLVSDASTRMWLERLNPDNESLYDAYGEDRPRAESYEEMIGRMLAPVRAGRRVCVALYGHPGVYVYPSHEAIRRARAEGFRARMLPGVSAEDCLYADLELDPAVHGCRSYEATDFLTRRRPPDPTTGLLLWQVGAIGVSTYYPRPIWRVEGVRFLADALLETYPPEHEVVVYTASTLPMFGPEIRRMPLSALPDAAVSVASTLYLPPLADAPLDREMLARLGMPEPGSDGPGAGPSC